MKILMVCLGNICRSPLAEGIMQHLIEEQGLDWEVDSAGTSGWHEDELPDKRSVAVAKSHNIDITHQRSRKFVTEDFHLFDKIYVMDQSNYQDVLRLLPSEESKLKVDLLLNASNPGMNNAVPDPYYEGGFEGVYQMIKDACEVIVNREK